MFSSEEEFTLGREIDDICNLLNRHLNNYYSYKKINYVIIISSTQGNYQFY